MTEEPPGPTPTPTSETAGRERPPSRLSTPPGGWLPDMATWPNLITFVRLLCIPLFLWLLFAREHRAAAAWLLAGLGSTDWFDGWIARRYNQVSTFGKVFDPTVDRLMFMITIPAIMIDDSVPWWVGGLVLTREGLVAIAAVTLIAAGGGRFDVTWEGKVGAFLLMFSFPMFLGSESTLSYAGLLGVLSWVFAFPGIAYSWYSLLFQYWPEARRRGRA